MYARASIVANPPTYPDTVADNTPSAAKNPTM